MKKQLLALVAITSISLQAGFLGNTVDAALNTPGRVLNGDSTQNYSRHGDFRPDRYNY